MGWKRHNLLGKQFGRWTVIGPAPDDSGHRSRWKCVCTCGKVKDAIYSINLIRGRSQSCGCWVADVLKVIKTTHGHTDSVEYAAWCKAKGRCDAPNDKSYKHYGGRGITMCERWRDSFASFLADMGVRPSDKHSLDRIDVNGDYSPSNCRWATPKQQQMNKRRSVNIVYQGVLMSRSDVARRIGLERQVFIRLWKRNVSIEDMIKFKRNRTLARESWRCAKCGHLP